MQYNLFMYCNGDPVNGYDPSGYFDIFSEIKAVITDYVLMRVIDELNGADKCTAIAHGVCMSYALGDIISFAASGQIVSDSNGHVDIQLSYGDGFGKN